MLGFAGNRKWIYQHARDGRVPAAAEVDLRLALHLILFVTPVDAA